MFRAVPPAPIAALGNQQFLLRQGALLGGSPGLALGKEIARLGQQVPSPVVFLASKSDIEIGVDPGAGSQARQRLRLTKPVQAF